jgi:hypothetical protein
MSGHAENDVIYHRINTGDFMRVCTIRLLMNVVCFFKFVV